MDHAKLIMVLMELRDASKLDAAAAMREYDMLFLGAEMNTISAIELRHSLENVFYESVTMEGLLETIPIICGALKMPIEAMTTVGDPERKISDYSIKLW